MEADKPKICRSNLIYSLRTRLMLSSFLLILLPMILVAWPVLYLVQEHLRDDANGQLQSDLSAASLYFQGEVEKVRSAVLASSQDNVVKTTLRLGITGQLQKQLVKLARQRGLDFLIIVGVDGKVQLSYLAQPEIYAGTTRVDLSDHPLLSFAAKRQSRACTLLEESSFVLHLLEHRGKEIDFRPIVVIEAVSPIILRKQFLGTIFGGVMATDNLALLDEIETIAGDSQVELVAADRMAAGADIIDQETGKRQVYFSVKLDYANHVSPGVDQPIRTPFSNIQVVYDYLPLAIPGQEPEIALVVERPLADFLEVLKRISVVLLSVFAAAMVIALIAAAVMSRFIARPLQTVVASMRKMHQENGFDPLPCDRNDEIGELIAGYNEMALALETRIRELGEEINYREEAEIKLAMESERLRVTLQSMDDAVVATDTDENIVLMNRIAEQWTGCSLKEAVGCPVKDILKLTGSDGTFLVDSLRYLSRKEFASQPSLDLQMIDVSGEQKIVTLSGSQLINRNGEIVGSVLVLRDVTEKRRMDAEITRGQKLESVGVLAGGIAHDFNNLLTAILGNLSLASLASSEEAPYYKNIKDAEKASLRARELTQQLLTFSQGGSPVKGNVDLKELVRESAEFVVRGSNVQLRFSMDEDLWMVTVDRGQIGQVVDNLVINAMQAMPDGGCIDIRLSNCIPDRNTLLPLGSSRYVKIVVKDYGTGIPRHRLNHIFDPYFTTKETGTGLGLAICFSIISKHGGHITVDSEPGTGSRFSVYLPAESSRNSTAGETGKMSLSAVSAAGQRILVMDDEELVCSVVTGILEHFGFKADIAGDGAKALEMYRQAMEEGKPYSLIIMDLTIPGGMGGQEAIKRLLQLDPSAKAIVSSGYSSHEVMANFADYGFAGVVVKPFKIDDLGRVLQEVLGS